MPFWNPLIGGRKVLELTYSSPSARTTTFNLKTWVDGALGDPSGAKTATYKTITVNIPNDYYFGSPSPGTASFQVGSWGTDQDIIINNSGYIVGKGGDGGRGAGAAPSGTAFPATQGIPGSPGIFVQSSLKSLTINNGPTGTMASGGKGGNGTGVTGPVQSPNPDGDGGFVQTPIYVPGNHGGGGAGYTVGDGGSRDQYPVLPPPAPPATIVPSATGVPNGPFSFRAGINPVGPDGGPLGTVGTPATWISGPGTPKTTIVNTGNIYQLVQPTRLYL